MNLKITAIFFLLFYTAIKAEAQSTAPDKVKVKGGELTIQPVQHATFILTAADKTIYVDPTGGQEAFDGMKSPDIILITDIHGDHFDPKTITAVKTDQTLIIAPQAVADKLSDINKEKLIVLKNDDKTKQYGITFTAIPMYNIPKSADAFHPKGRGNGYVLNIGGKNIYISGDTEDIPEMKTLKNIDIAFVCMNLPYTMNVEQAAGAVLAFKPAIVYPYHFRSQDGLSDVNKFKALVNAGNKGIDVRLKNWYPEKSN